MYKIEKGVPIPKPKAGNGKSVFPWREMEVGDSFLVTDRKQSNVSALARHAHKATGRRFTTRTMPDGIRVWRTE